MIEARIHEPERNDRNAAGAARSHPARAPSSGSPILRRAARRDGCQSRSPYPSNEPASSRESRRIVPSPRLEQVLEMGALRRGARGACMFESSTALRPSGAVERKRLVRGEHHVGKRGSPGDHRRPRGRARGRRPRAPPTARRARSGSARLSAPSASRMCGLIAYAIRYPSGPAEQQARVRARAAARRDRAPCVVRGHRHRFSTAVRRIAAAMILDELSRAAAAALLELLRAPAGAGPDRVPGGRVVRRLHDQLLPSREGAPQGAARDREGARRASSRASRRSRRPRPRRATSTSRSTGRRSSAAAVPPALADAAAARRERRAARGGASLVEFSAPNTNKPQHLGHLRNNFLGDAVSRILENAGSKVFRVNLVNDRGIHICKSMLAYERWGGGVTPESSGKKGDHLVGDFYVRFETEFQKELDAYVAAHLEEFEFYFAENSVDRKGNVRPRGRGAPRMARDVQGGGLREDPARARRAGDAPQLGEGRRGDGRALAQDERLGLRRVRASPTARLGISFDKVYLESETWQLGKRPDPRGARTRRVPEARRTAPSRSTSRSGASAGRWCCAPTGPRSTSRRTSARRCSRRETGTPDALIWVVGDEQRHHFKVLFKILELMGYAWALVVPPPRLRPRQPPRRPHEVARGNGRRRRRPDGRGRGPRDARRSSPRAPATPAQDLDERAEKIALAALRFMLLKVNPQSTMVYNPKESVSFDGETGPYLLYTAARIKKMLQDGGVQTPDAAGFDADDARRAVRGRGRAAAAAVPPRDRTGRDRAEPGRSSAATSSCSRRPTTPTTRTSRSSAPRTPRRARARLLLSAATRAVLARGCELLGIGDDREDVSGVLERSELRPALGSGRGAGFAGRLRPSSRSSLRLDTDCAPS